VIRRDSWDVGDATDSNRLRASLNRHGSCHCWKTHCRSGENISRMQKVGGNYGTHRSTDQSVPDASSVHELSLTLLCRHSGRPRSLSSVPRHRHDEPRRRPEAVHRRIRVGHGILCSFCNVASYHIGSHSCNHTQTNPINTWHIPIRSSETIIQPPSSP
jgi:hypothetical protein